MTDGQLLIGGTAGPAEGGRTEDVHSPYDGRLSGLGWDTFDPEPPAHHPVVNPDWTDSSQPLPQETRS
jgi:hypothetical protein